MLDCALEFEAAFLELKLQNINFKYNPSDDEWKAVENVCRFLKVFYDSTNVEIWVIKSTLVEDAIIL